MKISQRERNILILAAVVALIFVSTSGWPAIKSVYTQRQDNIESVEIDIAREQRLIENTASWRERRVEVESQIDELHNQLFSGATIPIVEANIQRASITACARHRHYGELNASGRPSDKRRLATY